MVEQRPHILSLPWAFLEQVASFSAVSSLQVVYAVVRSAYPYRFTFPFAATEGHRTKLYRISVSQPPGVGSNQTSVPSAVYGHE